MVVLCANPDCGAVLRVGLQSSLTEAVIESDLDGRYFACPRCALRTRLDSGRREPPQALPGEPQPS
jgi:hypothetical protein